MKISGMTHFTLLLLWCGVPPGSVNSVVGARFGIQPEVAGSTLGTCIKSSSTLVVPHPQWTICQYLVEIKGNVYQGGTTIGPKKSEKLTEKLTKLY